jgi:CBS domain-containing protein
VIGILSERDVIRAVAERGAGALTEPLARVMTRKISTCTQSDPVNSIMEQMTAEKFRHVPVVEEERLALSAIGAFPCSLHTLQVF